jgi:ATP-dependent Lon protease
LELPRGTLFPVLPLRDIVVFPHMIVPLFVGRDKSVRALEDVMKDDKQILLVTQKNAAQDDPTPADIYSVGTIGTVLQLLKLPDGTVKVLVEGGQRACISRYEETENFFQAYAEVMADAEGDDRELDALSRTAVSQFEQYIKLNKKIPPEVLVSINQIDDASKLADTIASHLTLKIPEKQELLECGSVGERLEKVYAFMEGEIGVLQVEKRIRNRVKRQMEKTQREYYLNEQLKAIQKELGEGEDGRDELAELEERIKETKLSKEASEKCITELKKLRSMSPMSAEATVVRNYLDWILSIPWKKRTKVRKDINYAQTVLDADHYGLEKVKERILEYLAVQQRMRKVKGPILCLVGPPGVGKTSLGKSIARATGRNFVRMSLGGVRDVHAGQGHPEHEEGQVLQPVVLVRRGGQAWRRLARRSLLGAVGGLGPGTEQHLRRPLSGGRLRSLRRHVRHHGEHAAHAAAAPRSHGGHPPARLYGRREGRDCQASPDPQADEGARGEGKGVVDFRRGAARPHPLFHARGRRAQPRAGACQSNPQGGEGDRAQEGRKAQYDAP